MYDPCGEIDAVATEHELRMLEKRLDKLVIPQMPNTGDSQILFNQQITQRIGRVVGRSRRRTVPEFVRANVGYRPAPIQAMRT